MMDTTCTLARSVVAVSLAFGLGLPAWAQEGGFFEDAKGGLTLRNYYFNRDFRDPGPPRARLKNGPRVSSSSSARATPRG